MFSRSVHPGEILKDELEEFGVSQAAFARQIEVPPNRVSQIIAGKRSVTGGLGVAVRALVRGRAPILAQSPKASLIWLRQNAELGQKSRLYPRRSGNSGGEGGGQEASSASAANVTPRSYFDGLSTSGPTDAP